MARLETIDVTVRFGGKHALDAVTLALEPNRVTGLIGPNGAGKTTMFNVVTGLLMPLRGRIILEGKDVTKAPPHQRARHGLARTFQRLELFPSLSVLDNVRVAGEIRNSWGFGAKLDPLAEARRLIERVGLGDVADREVSEIPTGRARLVELARALMTRPSVLLLDEPAAGQTDVEKHAFGQLVRTLVKDDGLAVCLVEHDVSLVMDVCDVIHVLDFGRVIATGPPAEISHDPMVVQAYLGSPAGAVA
jgi:branched-chain amino acid transport system ATP-binding protein